MDILSYASNSAKNAVYGVTESLQPAVCAMGGTALGVVASALSIITLGNFKKINEIANNGTAMSEFILPNIYRYILKVVNPEASFNQGKGALISLKIALPIYGAAKTASESNFFIAKHICSRVGYALAGLATLVTKAADLMLGLVAAMFSLFPGFGMIKKLNQLAINQLSALSLVAHLSISIRGIVDPQQFV